MATSPFGYVKTFKQLKLGNALAVYIPGCRAACTMSNKLTLNLGVFHAKTRYWVKLSIRTSG